jgi:hypothetical protein
MKHGDRILEDMDRLIRLFAPHCSDCETLDELAHMIPDRTRWRRGHDLFDRIRSKTLAAESAADRRLTCQYLFEEVCAKTLYNLSGESAPFDADSPYWIIPNALSLARSLGLPDAHVVSAVAP